MVWVARTPQGREGVGCADLKRERGCGLRGPHKEERGRICAHVTCGCRKGGGPHALYKDTYRYDYKDKDESALHIVASCAHANKDPMTGARCAAYMPATCIMHVRA
eukprot:365877-Chlamydomonas_euryale.AAC.5